MIPDIRSRLGAHPFQPFQIALADGRVFDINGPDMAWVTPRGGVLIYEPATDGIERLNSFLIASVKGPAEPRPAE